MAKKVTRKKAKKKTTRKKVTRKKAAKKKVTRKKAKKKATRKKVTRKKAAKKKATRKKAKKKATRKKAAKKVTKKKATKKKATRKKAKKKAKKKRKVNPAFARPLKPSAVLADVIGSKAIPRSQVIKRIWDYIKKHQLQNPKNRRNILADAKLRQVFGKGEVTMFELTKIVNKHLS